MSRFVFELLNVLKLRERKRDQAADSVRQAQLALDKLHHQIDLRLAEYSEQTPVETKLSTGTVSPQRMVESQRYKMHLMQQVAEFRSQVELVEQEREKRQRVLIACEQDVKAMEKLREKQAAAWQASQLAREQLDLDEWASGQFWEKQSRG